MWSYLIYQNKDLVIGFTHDDYVIERTYHEIKDVSDIKQPTILYENNDAQSNKNSTYLNGIYEENSECEQSESLDFS